MKQKYISLFAKALTGLFLVFAPTACSDDDDPVVNTGGISSFEVENVVIPGDIGSEEYTVTFRAGNDWTAMFGTTNNWLEMTPTKGRAGQNTIKLIPLSNNKGATVRKVQLYVLVDGEADPHIITITQESSAESDLKINGDVNEGVMTLKANSTGSDFEGVLEITSSRRWTATPEGMTGTWLSFKKDKEPQNGKETTVKLTVSARYNAFTAPEMQGAFVLTCEGTNEQVRIEVVAHSVCNIYENERLTEGETERTAYELVDTISPGTYQTTFYVEANVKWVIDEMPEWLEVAGGETATNMKTDGQLNSRRVGVGLALKSEYISVTPRTTTLKLYNDARLMLKEVEVSFPGTGSNYLSHNFSFPATDPLGNSFSFEARAEYIDPDNRNDYWKKMELPFTIQTSQNYTSIEDAPYHLVLCKSINGALVRQEVHWATLRLGDDTKSTESNGIFSKEVYLRANDRPDADDRNGITAAAEEREAFMFIVPKDVRFDDLFNGEGTGLKSEYAETFSRFVQKQDHNATYVLSFDGLTNKQELTVPATGTQQTFNILQATTEQMGVNLKRLFKPAGSDTWTEQKPTSAQEQTVFVEFNKGTDNRLSSMTLNVGPNTTGNERRFRFYFHMFRGDGYEDIYVFQFDIIQPAQ